MATTEQQIITRTDFAGLPTRDLEESVRFYGEVLGLPRSVYMPDRNFAEFETGNLTLTIYDSEQMGLGFEPNKNAIALRVEDMEAARSELERRGLEFAGDTFDTGVCHMAFFSDPAGNALMLHHRYAPRSTEA